MLRFDILNHMVCSSIIDENVQNDVCFFFCFRCYMFTKCICQETFVEPKPPKPLKPCFLIHGAQREFRETLLCYLKLNNIKSVLDKTYAHVFGKHL